MKNKLDLNLATVLCEIIETGSVSATATRLQVSISSVSTNLNKLRKYYHNPLFFRQGNGMVPTALAIELYQLYRPALNLFDKAAKLESIAAQRNVPIRLRIAAAPSLELMLTDVLLDLTKDHQDMHWDIFLNPGDHTLRTDRLRNFLVDLDIGQELPNNRTLIYSPIFHSGLDILCRKNHSRLDKTITLEQYKQEKVLGLIPSYEQIGKKIHKFQFVDDALLYRNYRCSTSASIFIHVSQTDLITLLPAAISKWACQRFDLKVLTPDFPIVHSTQLFAHTHHSNKNNPVIMKIIEYLSGLGHYIPPSKHAS